MTATENTAGKTPAEQLAVNAESAAKRSLRNMAQMIRRTGTTGWVKNRTVTGHYREVFEQLVIIEDVRGVNATAKLSDRLRDLRDEARAAGMLSVDEIGPAEQKAITNADQRLARII
jgi:hypothetical protein